jgi:PhnO protein
VNFRIRHAEPGDSRAVFELICDLESSSFDYPCFEKLYLGNLSNEGIIYLVSEEEGEVTGFLSCHGQALLHHMGKVFEIQELVVKESLRNRKIGELLLRRAEELVKQGGDRFIEVATNIKREAAHRFYDKCGYARTHYKFTKDLLGPEERT